MCFVQLFSGLNPLSFITTFYHFAVKHKHSADLPSLFFGNNLGTTNSLVTALPEITCLLNVLANTITSFFFEVLLIKYEFL